MHGDRRREGCKHQQGIEKHSNHVARDRHATESLLEHIRQRYENERRTTIGLYTHREGGRENHESCQDSNERIEQSNLSGRTQQISIALEIRSIGAETGGAETQGEKGLT